MKSIVMPYKPKRVTRKKYKKLIQFLSNSKQAPVEQLQKEAVEFEKMMLARRAAKYK
jgi:hypothetical protein